MKHESYWLTPESVRGFALKRVTASVSRSTVAHFISHGARQILWAARRYGFTFHIHRLTVGIYVERQGVAYDTTPQTDYALAVAADPK